MVVRASICQHSESVSKTLRARSSAGSGETVKSVISKVLAGVIGCSLVQYVDAHENSKTKLGTVYSFCGQKNCSDGENPTASPIDADGMLFGTTFGGGATGGGTVYSLSPNAGTLQVLYSFCSQQNCADGASPRGGLIFANSQLYGTTSEGGASRADGGTVFSVDPNTGAHSLLYVFCSQPNCADGDSPQAGVVDVNSTLYGTTEYGGAHGAGAVFALDLGTGTENTIYSFCAEQGCVDGGGPLAGLIATKGMLYGTTGIGGANSGGAVFAIDLATGAERVLYSFCSQQNCADGKSPRASLIYEKGLLYGTTVNGGAGCSGQGCGVVFSLDSQSGVEQTLHMFGSGADGSSPLAELIDIKGTLYGTTAQGGTGGWGTVFALDAITGTETILVSFGGATGGAQPLAGILHVKGTLYTTTAIGGSGGQGTVFALKK
jgi:uncharacterized repeat protein (TIGR03803 family)